MWLHPLLAECVDETGTRPGIHRLDEAETPHGGIRLAFITTERDQTLVDDRLEPALLPAADIAAIHADKQRSIRLARYSAPVRSSTIMLIGVDASSASCASATWK